MKPIGIVIQSTTAPSNAENAILDAVRDQGSPQLAARVGDILTQVQTDAALGGPVGVLTLLFAAIAIFAQFEQAFDAIWNVEQSAGGVVSAIKNAAWNRLRAFGVLASLGAVVLVAFVADVAISTMSRFTDDVPAIGAPLFRIAQVGVALAVNWLAVTILFRVMPKVQVRWSEAARGGLLVALAWEVGRRLIAALLISDKYSAYGVIGSFIALLLWIYCGTAIIFLGAEYVQVICRECEKDESSDGNDSDGRSSDRSRGEGPSGATDSAATQPAEQVNTAV